MQPSIPSHEEGCEGGDVERGEGPAKRQRTLGVRLLAWQA